jgi:hypothetical protein
VSPHKEIPHSPTVGEAIPPSHPEKPQITQMMGATYHIVALRRANVVK